MKFSLSIPHAVPKKYFLKLFKNYFPLIGATFYGSGKVNRHNYKTLGSNPPLKFVEINVAPRE